MSADSPARRRKISEKETEDGPRPPMFGVQHGPLPEKPTPLQTSRDPFADPPEGRPRAIRALTPSGRADAGAPRPPVPLDRTPAPDLLLGQPAHGPAEPERRTAAKKRLDLQQVDTLAGRMVERAPMYHRPAPRETPVEFVRGRPWLLILVVAVSLIVFWFTSATPKTIISTFGGAGPIAASNAISNVFKNQNVPAGQHTVIGRPTITAQFVDSVLARYRSPAQGTGQIWIEMGQQYGIDPAYALAFFIQESSAGTNPGWAGIKPGGGGSTHNIGNIICAGYATCFGGFRDYASWDDGIEDWYKLISKEYIEGRGLITLEGILPVYCPINDGCLTSDYVTVVNNMVERWRQGATQ